MSKSLFAAAIVTASALASPASALQFTFDFVPQQALFGQPVSGSGIFTTSDTATTVGGRTAYQITGVSGTVNGSAIVAPTGSYGNYFTDAAGFLDGSGTRFFTASGIDVRFFQQSNNAIYRVNTFGAFGSSEYVTANSSLVPNGVPEPAAWALMISGFGLVGFSRRRARRAQSLVA